LLSTAVFFIFCLTKIYLTQNNKKEEGKDNEVYPLHFALISEEDGFPHKKTKSAANDYSFTPH